MTKTLNKLGLQRDFLRPKRMSPPKEPAANIRLSGKTLKVFPVGLAPTQVH